MASKKGELVFFSNDIAKAKYKFSLPTQKLLLFLVSQITYEERKEGQFLKELRFPLSDILKFYKEAGREKSKALKERLIYSIEEIKNKKISLPYVDENGKEKYKDYPWHNKIELESDTKDFIFKFNHDLSRLLLEIKNYFKSNLKEFLSLKSSYAINLYLFLRAQAFQKKAQLHSIEKLKKYLQVEKKSTYYYWYSFKKYILDVAFEQLSKQSQYFFEYTFKKEGHKVDFITVFMIDKNDPKEFQSYILRKIKAHLKAKEIDKYLEEIKKMNFSYDFQKDIFRIDLSKTTFHKENIKTLDTFFMESETVKKVFQKLIFTKKTKITYKVKEG